MLNFSKPEREAVEVESQTLYVHPLNAGQYAKLLSTMEELRKSNEAFLADFELLKESCKDADGKAIFATIQEAMEIPPQMAGKLLPICLKVNGMGDAEKKVN